ncbi:MAG TPA: hypothetical protein VHG08_04860 [Longimicrobium sp.]|nr:hypothetical protein [Longimicrobium sp.]
MRRPVLAGTIAAAACLAATGCTRDRAESPRTSTPAAQTEVQWSPLRTAAAGGGAAVFGLIGGGAWAERGPMYVLDVAEKRVVALGPDGTPTARVGRPGRGPGEFFHPAGLAADASGKLYVLDIGNQRLERFTWKGGALTYTGSIPLDFAAEHLCFLGGRLFLLGPREGHLIHEMEPGAGTIVRSFAPDATAGDPMLAPYRAGGYLLCGPGDEITFLPMLRPSISRFQASTGRLRDTLVIPGYREVRVSRHSSGGVLYQEPPEGRSHRASSIVHLANGAMLVQVGILRPGASSGHEIESLRSFVLDWEHRRAAEVAGLPRLLAARGNTALAALDDPEPLVRLIRLSIPEAEAAQ